MSPIAFSVYGVQTFFIKDMTRTENVAVHLLLTHNQDLFSAEQTKLIYGSLGSMTKYAACGMCTVQTVRVKVLQSTCFLQHGRFCFYQSKGATSQRYYFNLKVSRHDASCVNTHLFLAGGAGRVGGRRASTQSLLYVQIKLVQFPHQLAHRFRPGRLDLRRLLWVTRETVG